MGKKIVKYVYYHFSKGEGGGLKYKQETVEFLGCIQYIPVYSTQAFWFCIFMCMYLPLSPKQATGNQST